MKKITRHFIRPDEMVNSDKKNSEDLRQFFYKKIYSLTKSLWSLSFHYAPSKVICSAQKWRIESGDGIEVHQRTFN